jgi:SAM-dependent methyltransferase
LSANKFESVAENRVKSIMRHLHDLGGCDVLEVGTGRGYTAALLPSLAGVRHVTGIDRRTYPDWDHHDTEAATFVKGDFSGGQFIDTESIDAVISVAGMERVVRPIRTLGEMHRVLKPGGQVYLHCRLFHGVKAFTGGGEVAFPWPQLVLEPAEYEARQAQQGSGNVPWVNRMTAAAYVYAAVEAGFEISEVRRHVSDLEPHVDFYLRHEDRLSRYAALDLETDRLTLILTKLPEPGDRIPRLEYQRRQLRLDRLVRARKIALLEEQAAS